METRQHRTHQPLLDSRALFEQQEKWRYASLKELETAKAELGSAHVAFEEARLQVAAASVRVELLEIQMAHTQQGFDSRLTLAGAVYRLSWELLAEIFLIRIEDHIVSHEPTMEDVEHGGIVCAAINASHPSIAISSVSRRWREVALQTSLLWTHLHISPPFLSKATSLVAWDKWMAQVIRTWIKRSGNRLLDIAIEEHCDVLDNTMLEVGAVLLSQMSRCYKFLQYGHTISSIFTASSTPNLHEATIQTFESTLGSLFPHAPNLRRLTVRASSEDDHMFPIPSSSLTHLRLLGFYTWGFIEEVNCCANSLEELCLKNLGQPWGTPPSTRTITLPRLRTLRLQSIKLMWTELRGLNNLTRLHWEFQKFDPTFLQRIHQAAPLLEHVEFAPGPKASSLRNQSTFDEPAFIDGLMRFTRLKSLSIDSLDIDSNTLDAFADAQHPACPNLTHLHLRNCPDIQPTHLILMVHERRFNSIRLGKPARMEAVNLLVGERSVLEPSQEVELRHLLQPGA